VRWARWWYLWFFLQFHERTTTVTSEEIVYHQRVRMLAHAVETGNVTATCRVFGVSTKTFHKWRNAAAKYGLEALWPKTKRQPMMPNATPTHVVEVLLTMVVMMPTLGCRQYADRLHDQQFLVSKSTVQDLLVRHGLGRRHQRVARAAAIAAVTNGQVTDAATDDTLFGFCHWAGAPGQLVSIDSFYIGNLKGVGKVHQLTAVDVFTRWAIAWIVHGPGTAEHSIQFLERIRQQWRRLGYPIRAVVTDNGPEYVASKFADALARQNINRTKIPPRSPNHNAVVERFQGTMLQECWRPAFHRRHFTSIRQLQREADAWLITYDTRRRNHGHYMAGRRPLELLNKPS
jgi:transposase InsO family protein